MAVRVLSRTSTRFHYIQTLHSQVLVRGWVWIGFWDNYPPIPVASGRQRLELAPVFDQVPKNINVYELWPVVVTDNMQVLAMLDMGRSSNKLCMSWLREIFWCCFINNTDVFATYIHSADNILADGLSRAGYSGMIPKWKLLTCVVLHPTGQSLEHITHRQHLLQEAALAPSTRKSRQSQLQCYRQFCRQYDFARFSLLC